MNLEEQEILNVLAQAYGAEEARRISGSYRLAATLARLAQQQQAQPAAVASPAAPSPPQPNGKASQGAVRARPGVS